MPATTKRLSVRCLLTSAWTSTLVSVLVGAATIALADRVQNHQRAMSAHCGALVRMPTWCAYGYRVTIAVGVMSIAFAVVVPVWRKMSGAADLTDAVTGTLGRLALAGTATFLAILAFRDGAPYHVPCGGLGNGLLTGLVS